MLINVNEDYNELSSFVIQITSTSGFYSNMLYCKEGYVVLNSTENNNMFWYLIRIVENNIQLLQKVSIGYYDVHSKMAVFENGFIGFVGYRWYLFDIDNSFVNILDNLDDAILGIAKTRGNSGEIIKVYVPNFNESEEN